jgi:hypothetical protein
MKDMATFRCSVERSEKTMITNETPQGAAP